MTVSATTPQVNYVGTGSVSSYSYPFKIIADADLVVKKSDENDENEETLVLSTDYTVTGAGSGTGGNVILTDALESGYNLVILRSMSLAQDTDLVSQGTFFEQTHEDQFDKFAMQIQDLSAEVARSPKTSATSGDTGDELMASIATAVDSASASAASASESEIAAGDSETNAAASEVAAALSAATVNLPAISSGDSGKILQINSGETGYEHVGTFNNPSPSLRLDDFDQDELLNYLEPIHTRNAKVEAASGTYTHGATVVSGGYFGSVYSPTEDKIYFVPSEQPASSTTFHRVNCKTGAIETYTGYGSGGDGSQYAGGVYSPTQNRIYFIPYAEKASDGGWHYIDCATGTLETAALGAVATGDYVGGVYSPTQDRIYLVPYGRADETTWHYIDCSDGTLNSYTHGATAVNNAYFGGAYSPTQNRIYFAPHDQHLSARYHYIDCNDGTVADYTKSCPSGECSGAVYSPTQDRIYFVPHYSTLQTRWMYINCSDGSLTGYYHEATVTTSAYSGGVYSPAQNRIYLVPYSQANNTSWHYIDCSDGSVVAYTHGVTAGTSAYIGGTYSPRENRIYMSPYLQGNVAVWHYIQVYASEEVSPQLMSTALFSKY